jgi:HSP20 family protein
MTCLVPFSRNTNKGDITPYQMARSFLDSPFFGGFGLTPISWAGGIHADVTDTGNEYTLEAEMPGVAKDRINLEVKDRILTISVSEDSQHQEEKGGYISRERRRSQASRTFSLENVDENGIQAEYRDGILLVHLPKARQEENPARKIEIN